MNFRVGDTIWWVDEYRDAGPSTGVVVNSGRVVSHDNGRGGMMSVVVEIPEGGSDVVFIDPRKSWAVPDPASIIVVAFGIAARLILNYGYKQVTVKSGKQTYTFPDALKS